MRVSPPWGPWDRIFFSQWFWHIFKYFNSNHNLPSYSLRCVLVVLFFTPPLARDSLSRSPRACLRLTEKRWKIAPVLQIQASSMKLRVHGFLFLVFLHIKTDCKNKLFFYKHINIQIRRFFSELVWKLWKILPDDDPNWNEHSFTGLIPGDVSYGY